MASGSYDPYEALKRLIDAQNQANISPASPPSGGGQPGGGQMYYSTSSSFPSINSFSPGAAILAGLTQPQQNQPMQPEEDFEIGDECEVIGTSSIHGYPVGSIVHLTGNYGRGNGNEWLTAEGQWYITSNDMKKKNKKKKPPVYDPSKMDALIIDQKVKDEIVAVLDQHKNHDKLFTEWGLGEVIEYGRGMTFMFYGSPGTGKTWGATCIAKAIGTDLIVLSAAEVQSSEPGGANRAIQNAFKEAKEKHKVLFIDECDSLIASRNDLGMVLASEVNTLLTEIEKFEGVAILATNRIEHMDEALERRISLIVEFPKPNMESRKKIWAKLLPKKLPLGKEVSIDALAKHELTGGQIKNVVLQAARMALAGGQDKVEMKYFDLAIERLNKSKNLMGQASRYHQGIVRDDYGSSTGIGKFKNKDFKKFLEEETK